MEKNPKPEIALFNNPPNIRNKNKISLINSHSVQSTKNGVINKISS